MIEILRIKKDNREYRLPIANCCLLGWLRTSKTVKQFLVISNLIKQFFRRSSI